MTKSRYWWPTATTEDRLHQVKHAAEMRLTCGETAILLGTYAQAVNNLARRNGISFANSDLSLARRRSSMASDGAAIPRILEWRKLGMQNTEIFDRLDYRREVDDGDSHELRFTE